MKEDQKPTNATKTLVDVLQPTEGPRRLSNVEALAHLNDPARKRRAGRSLPLGYQWDGRDLPGRGKAAQRRLRQMTRRETKTSNNE